MQKPSFRRSRASRKVLGDTPRQNIDREITLILENRTPELGQAWTVLSHQDVDPVAVFQSHLPDVMSHATAIDTGFGWKALKALTPFLRNEPNQCRELLKTIDLAKLQRECKNNMCRNVFHYMKWLLRVSLVTFEYVYETGLFELLTTDHDDNDVPEEQVIQNVVLITEALYQMVQNGTPREVYSNTVHMSMVRIRMICEPAHEISARVTSEKILDLAIAIIEVGDASTILAFVKTTMYARLLAMWDPECESICVKICSLLSMMLENNRGPTELIVVEVRKRMLPLWLLNNFQVKWEIPQAQIFAVFTKLYDPSLCSLLDSTVIETILEALDNGSYLLKLGAMCCCTDIAIKGPRQIVDLMASLGVFSKIISLLPDVSETVMVENVLGDIEELVSLGEIVLADEDMAVLSALAAGDSDIAKTAELVIEQASPP